MAKSEYYKTVCEELGKLHTIIQRLDYWKTNIFSQVGDDYNKIAELFSLEGEPTVYGVLHIPISVWKEYFEPLAKEIKKWPNDEEYKIEKPIVSDWMTEFRAEQYGQYEIEKFQIRLKIANDPEYLIDIELKKILLFEEMIYKKVVKPGFNINELKANEFAYHSYKEKLYAGKATADYGDKLIQAIARHKYLKEFLQKLLKEEGAKEKITQSDSMKKPLIKDNAVYSFNWQNKIQINEALVILDLLLKKKNIIPKSTDINTLKKAFDGSELIHPLSIRWYILTKDKKNTSKSSLFYFLEKLGEEDYIEKLSWVNSHASRKNYKQIKLIFCDFKGSQFENLPSSNSQSVKAKPLRKSDIDEVIDSLPKTDK